VLDLARAVRMVFEDHAPMGEIEVLR
jgi:hypothetical protein